jgi:hypothetical protein
MPTCNKCGTVTNALHSGGDGNIPPPGVCDSCQQVAATVGRTRRQAEIAAKIAAASGGA